MIPTQQIYSTVSAKTSEIKSIGAKSISNFDFSSLTLLRPEINKVLQTAERNLSEFNHDPSQDYLLIDTSENLQQLAEVFNFISFKVSSHLAHALSAALSHLHEMPLNKKADLNNIKQTIQQANHQYDSQNQKNNQIQNTELLIAKVVQGIMSLTRYIEFALLQQTLEPKLLLPIINELRELIGNQPLAESEFSFEDYRYLTLANPTANFQSLESLDLKRLNLDSELLTTAYRAGLAVILASDNKTKLNKEDIAKVNAMHAACSTLANESKSLFWQAAAAVTKYRKDLLPLTEQKKSLYIFIEQQFRSYLPADDRRFAELVSFACQQVQQTSGEINNQIKIQLQQNKLSESALLEYKRIMQGPDQHVALTVKSLIDEEINFLKAKVDQWINPSDEPIEITEAESLKDNLQTISTKLHTLASTLQLLNQQDAAKYLTKTAKSMQSWSTPSAEDLDQLLTAFMIAENAAIAMTKSFIPDEQANALNNQDISISQLDTANMALIKQSRHMIRSIENAISDYMDTLFKYDYAAEDNHSESDSQSAATQGSDHLDHSPISETNDVYYQNPALLDIPNELKQLAGVLKFIDLTDAANTVNRLAVSLDARSDIEDNKLAGPSEAHYFEFSKMADILLAIDHQLHSKLQGRPVAKQAMYIANRSLSELVAA